MKHILRKASHLLLHLRVLYLKAQMQSNTFEVQPGHYNVSLVVFAPRMAPRVFWLCLHPFERGARALREAGFRSRLAPAGMRVVGIVAKVQ